MARRKRDGAKSGKTGSVGKGATGDAGKSPVEHETPGESSTKASELDAGSVGVVPPTVSPGAPPKKKRGRKSDAEKTLEKTQVEEKRLAEDKARRDAQASEINPIFSGALKYLSRAFASDEKTEKWAMTEKEIDVISRSTSAVIVKYADLSGLAAYQEEIALIIALGAYAGTRIEFSKPVESETDQKNAAT